MLPVTMVFKAVPQTVWPRWSIKYRKVTPRCKFCNEPLTRQTFRTAVTVPHSWWHAGAWHHARRWLRSVRRKGWNCSGCEHAEARMGFAINRARKAATPPPQGRVT